MRNFTEMKNTLFALLLALVFPILNVRADEVRLVADEWCPFNCASDAADKGVLIEIAEAALSKLGHKVVYKTIPWSRAIEASRRGEFDGIVGAYVEEAPDFIYPEKPLVVSGNQFFVRSNSNWRFTDIKSLENISIGVIRDYSYGAELDAYIKSNAKNEKRVQVAGGDDALSINVKKLLAGRLDAILEVNYVLLYHSKKMNLGDKLKPAGGIPPIGIMIGFTPKNPNSKLYAEAISKELESLKSSGKYSEILAKYGIKE